MTADHPICFVIMPISDQPNYEPGHFGHVYRDIIRPAIEGAGYSAARADETTGTNMIHHEILKSLISAPMAICDLSSRNPNVMFELGMRQAFDLPVVIIQDEQTPHIFDISGLRNFTYRNKRFYDEVIADQKTIAEAIRATAEQHASGSSANSLMRLLQIEKAIFDNSAPADPERAAVQFLQHQIENLSIEFNQLSKTIKQSALGRRESNYEKMRRPYNALPQIVGWGQSPLDQNNLARSLDPFDEFPASIQSLIVEYITLPEMYRNNFLDKLTTEAKKVVELRLGLVDNNFYNFSLIKNKTGITETEAKMLFDQAVFVLKEYMENFKS